MNVHTDVRERRLAGVTSTLLDAAHRLVRLAAPAPRKDPETDREGLERRLIITHVDLDDLLSTAYACVAELVLHVKRRRREPKTERDVLEVHPYVRNAEAAILELRRSVRRAPAGETNTFALLKPKPAPKHSRKLEVCESTEIRLEPSTEPRWFVSRDVLLSRAEELQALATGLARFGLDADHSGAEGEQKSGEKREPRPHHEATDSSISGTRGLSELWRESGLAFTAADIPWEDVAGLKKEGRCFVLKDRDAFMEWGRSNLTHPKRS